MSVYKSRRSVSLAEYIQHALRLRKITIRTVKRMPKSYRWIITNSLLELTQQIFVNCLKANGIPINEAITDEDFKLRHSYLMQANSSLVALEAEITFCYELIDVGNSAFKSKDEYDRIFNNWIDVASKTLKLVRGAISYDKARYKQLRK